mgnify:CR=1 FL=1
MKSQFQIARRPTRAIRVGRVTVGGDAPIAVQTMTNTDTEDVAATVAQIQAAQKAGADIVRVSVPTLAAARAFAEIKRAVGYMPLVADIHFNYKCGIAAAEAGADCLRINPGNIGGERKVDEMEAYADTIQGREPSLEDEFAALERDEAVEKELEALKKSRGQSSTQSTQSEG